MQSIAWRFLLWVFGANFTDTLPDIIFLRHYFKPTSTVEIILFTQPHMMHWWRISLRPYCIYREFQELKHCKDKTHRLLAIHTTLLLWALTDKNLQKKKGWVLSLIYRFCKNVGAICRQSAEALYDALKLVPDSPNRSLIHKLSKYVWHAIGYMNLVQKKAP